MNGDKFLAAVGLSLTFFGLGSLVTSWSIGGHSTVTRALKSPGISAPIKCVGLQKTRSMMDKLDAINFGYIVKQDGDNYTLILDGLNSADSRDAGKHQ